MKDSRFIVRSIRPLTGSVFEMVLGGDTSAMNTPGQFVDVALPGHFLRRPFAAADWDKDSLTMLIKVVGEGTREMSRMPVGTELDVLTGLGRGFSAPEAGERVLLVGGGMGLAPLYVMAKALGGKCRCVFGFNEEKDMFYRKEFEALGAEVTIATLDGSVGTKGFVTDAIAEEKIEYDRFYACGPMPMLKTFCAGNDHSGEVSLEARMGCGVGLCVGCTIETRSGHARVCHEGPVFDKEDIIW